MTTYKNPTEPYKTSPLDRVYLEIDSALADAFQRGRQEGLKEHLELLRRIVGAGGVPDMARALRDAEEELKKWGV